MQQKPSPEVKIAFKGDFNEPPKVPDDVVERFPSMRKYQSEIERWWQDLKAQLQRDRDLIASIINKP